MTTRARNIHLPFVGPPPDRETHVERQAVQFDPRYWKAALREKTSDGRWWPAALDEVGETIDRGQVRQLARTENERTGAAHLFVAASVWGAGNRRIKLRLNACDAGFEFVGDRLAEAARRVLVEDPAEVFDAMTRNGSRRISGIGPAFLTKFLYFAAYHPSDTGTRRQPLIFDSRVRAALRALCGLQLGEQREDYDTYLDVASTWAYQWHDTQPDVVERVLHAIGDTPCLAVSVLRGLPASSLQG